MTAQIARSKCSSEIFTYGAHPRYMPAILAQDAHPKCQPKEPARDAHPKCMPKIPDIHVRHMGGQPKVIAHAGFPTVLPEVPAWGILLEVAAQGAGLRC